MRRLFARISLRARLWYLRDELTTARMRLHEARLAVDAATRFLATAEPRERELETKLLALDDSATALRKVMANRSTR